MFQGSYVFSQIMSLVSHKQFQSRLRRDQRHKGDYKVKEFSCWSRLRRDFA